MERDSWDEQRLRALCAKHGWAWMPGESRSFGAGKTWGGFEGCIDSDELILSILLLEVDALFFFGERHDQ